MIDLKFHKNINMTIRKIKRKWLIFKVSECDNNKAEYATTEKENMKDSEGGS